MYVSSTVLQKHYRHLEAIALEYDEVEEMTDLTLPDHGRISRRAGQLLEQFKDLVYPAGYDPEQKPSAKRKVTPHFCNVFKHGNLFRLTRIRVQLYRMTLTVQCLLYIYT